MAYTFSQRLWLVANQIDGGTALSIKKIGRQKYFVAQDCIMDKEEGGMRNRGRPHMIRQQLADTDQIDGPSLYRDKNLCES